MAESYFGKELRNYYEKHGNRIIYRNGMTQNQLADHIAQMTDSNFEASIISRAKVRTDIFKKEKSRVPSQQQIDAIALGLEMTPDEHYALTYAVTRDLCVEKGLDINISITPPTLTLALDTLDRVAQARTLAFFPLAIDMLQDLYRWKQEIDGAAFTPPVMRVLSRLHLEHEELMAQIENGEVALAQRVVPLPTTSKALPQAETQTTPQYPHECLLVPTVLLELSPLEQKVWELYTREVAVPVIAEALQLHPATVHSVLERVRTTLHSSPSG